MVMTREWRELVHRLLSKPLPAWAVNPKNIRIFGSKLRISRDFVVAHGLGSTLKLLVSMGSTALEDERRHHPSGIHHSRIYASSVYGYWALHNSPAGNLRTFLDPAQRLSHPMT